MSSCRSSVAPVNLPAPTFVTLLRFDGQAAPHRAQWFVTIAFRLSLKTFTQSSTDAADTRSLSGSGDRHAPPRTDPAAVAQLNKEVGEKRSAGFADMRTSKVPVCDCSLSVTRQVSPHGRLRPRGKVHAPRAIVIERVRVPDVSPTSCSTRVATGTPQPVQRVRAAGAAPASYRCAA
jgi:hypothetical protein